VIRQGGYRGPGPQQAAAAAPARRGPRRRQVCRWCGGAGTHYLTCKTLRLPACYRLSAGSGPRCRCGLVAGTCGVCAR
jgi:hypothetical protein